MLNLSFNSQSYLMSVHDRLKALFFGAYLHKLFLHCLIYKVHSASQRIFILTYFSVFVKNFFKFFKILFDVRCAPGFRRSSHNFFILTYYLQLVNTFFQIFSRFYLLPPTVAGSLHILALFTPFVKYFFTKTRVLFCACLTIPDC